jgi:hypothetical protein
VPGSIPATPSVRRGEDVSPDAVKKGEYDSIQPTGEEVDIEQGTSTASL